MEYTNKDLACDYITLMDPRSKFQIEVYKKLSRSITSSKVNIPAFYKKNGDLDDLEVKGIGKKMKKDLTKILINKFPNN